MLLRLKSVSSCHRYEVILHMVPQNRSFEPTLQVVILLSSTEMTCEMLTNVRAARIQATVNKNASSLHYLTFLMSSYDRNEIHPSYYLLLILLIILLL